MNILMKRIITLLLVVFASTSIAPVKADGGATIRGIIEQARARRRARKDRKRIKQGVVAFWALGGRESIDALPCIVRHGVNLLYLKPEYYPRFARARADYKAIVIGDSTGAINALIPGWLNPKTTLSTAVPGNRLCHIRMTFRKSIRSTDPDVVILTTVGGNDLLVGADDNEIFAQALMLRNALRERFPRTRLVAVGIHPTLVRFANERKDALNARLGLMWSRDPETCWVDPLPAFGVLPGKPARADHMFPGDVIHYNERTAHRVGSLIREKCKLNF